MHLNHPEIIPPTMSMENLSSTKLGPAAKKVGDCWPIAAPPRETLKANMNTPTPTHNTHTHRVRIP